MGTLLAFPLILAATPSDDTEGPALQAFVAPGDEPTLDPTLDPTLEPTVDPDAARIAADQLAASFEARDQAWVSRSRPATAPTPAAAPATTPVPAAPAEPAPATPAPEAVTPEPPPAPEPVPAIVGQLWATTAVNIRSGPSTANDTIGSLAAITQVDVTGATDNGWTQVVKNGAAGWVKSSYLSEAKPEPKAESAPSSSSGVSGASCPISSSIESHLSSNARAVYRAVCAEFGGTVKSFGGYRAGDSGDHGSGHAVDIMVSGDPGTAIARYVQAHASELGVTYVIYQQKIWLAGNPTSQWKQMEDRGSATANHYDHVHVSVS